MTDTDTHADDTQQEQAQQEDDKSTGQGLRKQLETVLAENKQLKVSLRTSAFKEAGFDLNSGEGKALAKLYEGEADPEAIKKFAADEFGWEPGQRQQSERSEVEVQREQSQQRADQVNASSSSVPPPDDMQTQIATAEQAGDWQRSAALKNKLLTQQFYNR